MRQLLIISVLILNSAFALAGHAADKQSDDTWALNNAAGKSFQFPADLQAPAILFFWATWCPYCKNLMPHLQSIVDEYAAETGLKVYAINVWDDGDAAAYLEERGYGFELLLNGEAVADHYALRGTPGVLIVAPNGDLNFDLRRLTNPQRASDLSGLKNWQKATRLAPYWAAQMRQSLDRITTGKN